MILIDEADLSAAWIATLDAVLAAGGTAINVVTSWPAHAEVPQVRQVLDNFVRTRPERPNASPRWLTDTVANTIFPDELYDPELGEQALEQFSEWYLEQLDLVRLASPGGEYCQRLVAWDGPDGEPINQLATVADKLARYADPDRHFPYSSDYELAIEDPALDLRTQMPGRNGSPYGFPCLSHISLTVERGLVHLTALYRNQHLIHKAYGNYLGLSRLLRALCHHAGLDAGTVTVIATHADAETTVTGQGKRALHQLLADVRTAHAVDRTEEPKIAEGLEHATRTLAETLTAPATHAIGVDAVHVADLAADLDSDEAVLGFVAEELADTAGDHDRLAARFAAKEATLKALGTGIRGIGLEDVVVETAADGSPSIRLSPAAQQIAEARGLSGFACSLTHEEGFAIAIVIADRQLPPDATRSANDDHQENRPGALRTAATGSTAP